MNSIKSINDYNKTEFYELPKWNKILEDNYLKIKEEYLTFIENNASFCVDEVDKTQEYLNKDKKWKMILLKLFEREYLHDEFKNTHALIKEIPGCVNVFFSILEANSKIPPHVGYYPGFTRYHLGLIVPFPELCFINVNGITRNWYNGTGLMFDDTYEHFVENNSNLDRVVLFVDLKKDLPQELIPLNDKYISALSKTQGNIIDKNWINILNSLKKNSLKK